jgi:hypothetical protein
MLIYRINTDKTHQIDHFEPHGKICNIGNNNTNLNKKINGLMIHFKQGMETIFDVSVTYNPPSEICPNTKGVQSIHRNMETSDWEGFCSIWSLLFAELIILAPEYTSKEIYDSFLVFTSKYATKNYVIMDKIIQGYLMTLDERLLKYGNRYLKLRYLITNSEKSDEKALRQMEILESYWFEKIGKRTLGKNNGGKSRSINTSKKNYTKKYRKKMV